jgi:hypothetical protein
MLPRLLLIKQRLPLPLSLGGALHRQDQVPHFRLGWPRDCSPRVEGLLPAGGRNRLPGGCS